MSKAEVAERQIHEWRRLFGTVAGWTRADVDAAVERVFDFFGRDGVAHVLDQCGVADPDELPPDKFGEFISTAAMMTIAGESDGK